MRFTRRILLALPPLLIGMQACKPATPLGGTYTVSVFDFRPSAAPSSTSPNAPSVWIDSNTTLSFSSRTVTSSLPCSVMIDYTDHTAAIRSAEFTSIRITYDDGAVDPGPDSIALPVRIRGREYESVNSVSGGRIVRSKSWIISGRIPGVITRADSFRLFIEGRFIQNDGTSTPFVIDQHFEVRRENAQKPAEDVLQDK